MISWELTLGTCVLYVAVLVEVQDSTILQAMIHQGIGWLWDFPDLHVV
jgi:hypothetical protein